MHRDIPVTESFEGNLEQVARRVRQVGASVNLVGYSLGARVALGLLASRPELVASATLVSVHPGLALERRASRTPRVGKPLGTPIAQRRHRGLCGRLGTSSRCFPHSVDWPAS